MFNTVPDLFKYRLNGARRPARRSLRADPPPLRHGTVLLVPDFLKDYQYACRSVPLRPQQSQTLARIEAMKRYREVKSQVAHFRPALDDIAVDRLYPILYRTLDARFACFAYPGVATVAFIQGMCRNSILEVGAGTGTWARVLASAGLDVLATDIAGGRPESMLRYSCMKTNPAYPVEALDGITAIQRYPDRDVLIVMPNPDDNWYIEAILSITQPGRRLLILPDIQQFDLAEIIDSSPVSMRLHEILHDASTWRKIGHSTGRQKMFAFERL